MGKGSRNREIRISENQLISNPETKLSKRQLIKQQEKKEKMKKTITLAATVVIAVALIVSIVVVTLNKAPKLDGAVSATAGEWEIDNGMMAYFMYSQYQTFVQSNYYYLSYYGLDTTKTLKSQTMAGGETTWFTYFMNAAKSQVNELVALAKEAEAKGYKFSDDDAKDIEEAIASLESSATASGYTSLNKYLAANYISGVTENSVRKSLRLQQYAANYYTDLYESYEYTDEEIAEYVEDNPESFYKFDYYYYTFTASYGKDATDAEKKEALEKAKSDAAAFLEKATDEESFKSEINALEKAKADAKGESSSTTAAETGSSSSATEKDYAKNFLKEEAYYVEDDEFFEWAFENERKAGDINLITNKDSSDNETGYTAYIIIKPAYKDDYKTKDVRHILFTTSTYGTLDKAKAKAEEVLAEYNKGDKTAEAFGKLAEKYTEDTGSKEDGGLYEEVVKEYMVEEFDEWIYDEKRKTGDVEIIKTDYGYHIMYFVGDGREAWKIDSEGGLKSEQYQDELEALIKKYPVTYDNEKLALIP